MIKKNYNLRHFSGMFVFLQNFLFTNPESMNNIHTVSIPGEIFVLIKGFLFAVNEAFET